MKRILIIGCPGSGKSTLSRRLADILALPLIHLDLHHHDESRWPADPAIKKERWREFVRELTAQPKWIIDGNYKGSFDIRFPAADTIVFLDYARPITIARLLRRRFQRRSRPDMPSTWREKISWDFLVFAWTYRHRERGRVLALLKEHEDGREVVILRSPKEASTWLDDVERRRAMSTE